MTPTPQERTKLQRLAELCSPEEWYDPDDLVSALADKFGSSKGTAADAAFIAACSPAAILALLSLAAESEELRVDNQRMIDESQEAFDDAGRFATKLVALESHYTALVEKLDASWTDGLDAVDACRHWKCACAIEGKSGARRFLAILSSLTPKEGE